MIDLENIETLARAATPGPWVFALMTEKEDPEIAAANGSRVATLGAADITKANSAYIAAANPAAVLELIEKLRVALAAAPMQAQEPIADASADIFDLIREWAHLPEGQRGDAARNIIGCLNRSYSAGVSDGKELGRLSAPVQPVAVPDGSKPIAPAHCPITGRKFWGNIDHPERGLVATYGGPFDTYSIPYLSDDNELRVERFDQDAGDWVEGGEPCGWYSDEQPAIAPAAQGDAKELTDKEIVQAVRSVGVDTHPSKFGFKEQIEGMSVTVLRQVIAAIAAKAVKS